MSSAFEDALLLEGLGYHQELHRGLTSLMSFALCFTAVSVLSSLTVQVGFGLATGGPAAMLWGWLLGSCFSILAGLSMAEICSTFPTAGSVYHWAGHLCDPPWSGLASYITGWFNLLGNTCAIASFAYGLAQLLGAALGSALSTEQKVAIALGVNMAWALLNTLRVEQFGWINNFAAVLQVVSTLGISGLLIFLGSGRGSVEAVFFETYNDTGFSSSTYVSSLGLLTTLFTFSGYEGGSHMAEETRHASTAAPLGIVATCLLVAPIGFVYILGLLLALPSVNQALAADDPALFIFVANAGQAGGSFMALLVVANIFFAGMSSLAVTARTCFAMARDRDLPGKGYLDAIDPTTKTPFRATLAILLVADALLLLPLANETAFEQITALSTIGFQISYAIPILLRVTTGRRHFVRGHFHLGAWALPVGWAAGIWLTVTAVLFFLPIRWPITARNANYAPAVVGAIVLMMAAHWHSGARHHHHRPGG